MPEGCGTSGVWISWPSELQNLVIVNICQRERERERERESEADNNLGRLKVGDKKGVKAHHIFCIVWVGGGSPKAHADSATASQHWKWKTIIIIWYLCRITCWIPLLLKAVADPVEHYIRHDVSHIVKCMCSLGYGEITCNLVYYSDNIIYSDCTMVLPYFLSWPYDWRKTTCIQIIIFFRSW